MKHATRTDLLTLALALSRTANGAGLHILDVKRKGFTVNHKRDESPVTEADRRAETFILADLERLAPGIPVIAEESCAAGLIPDIDGVFFLVDPLDGTHEFLGGRAEYTVNIALIEDRKPVMGVIGVPETGDIYIGAENWAGRAKGGASKHEDFETITTRTPGRPVVALASLSHADPQTEAFLKGFPEITTLRAGSSLKFARVAEGAADIYPRFGPTCEWDTAAGHAVLSAAGGRVLTPDGEPFLYGKCEQKYRNGPFIAWGRLPA